MRAISPAMFIAFRELLGMNKEQCAAYLRIDVRTLHRWESGRCPISFAAFELLRVIQESVTFKMSHPVWDGWFISMDGVLVSPDLGGNQGLFTPGRLNYIASQGTEASHLRREVNRLEAELNETKEENTQLRQMFVAQGVVDELAAMQNTISELMNRIATARIIQFPAAPIDQPQEIAA
ncbi:MAG: hypothetical protein EPN14_08005 [Gallionella sp.]|nr:MAG: hypothetical protein EPN14_08005 [Gallionella sp.]